LKVVVGILQQGIKNNEIGRPSFAFPIELIKEIYPDLQVGIPTAPGGLPPGSYIPFPRNALFTGREADLEKLKALCEPNGSNIVISQAVIGMGGIGKTQLAVEFAYRYGHHFKGVHWLDLRDPVGLETEIAKNGEKMFLQPWPDELPAQVATTLNTWQTDGPRLIILDNFEEVGLANDVLAQFQHHNLRILLTSRRSDWPSNLGLQSVGLKVFTKPESLKFLKELLEGRKDSTEELENLAEHLGHLPLALELAGRYLQGKRLTILAYKNQLENVLEHRSMNNWKPELKSATKHDLSLIQTFTLSWDLIQNKTSQKAFIMAGFLAPNSAVPLEIFESSLDCSQERCDETLEELFGLGLLRKLEGDSPAIHPLLAEFARDLDAKNTNLAILSEKLAGIAIKRNDVVDQTGNYSLFTPLLPHIRSIAEKAEEMEIEQAGSLWNSLGYHISDLADYAGAQAAYERAIKIGEAAFGPDHPSVAIRVNNLGGVLQDLGDLKGAQAAYERALKIFKQFLPEGHPNIKIVERNLRSLDPPPPSPFGDDAAPPPNPTED